MRKSLTTALAAMTMVGGVLASATPASAEHYGYGGYRNQRSGSDKAAIAVAAGIAGLALGAALSGKSTGRSGYGSTYSSGYSSRSNPYRNGYDYNPRNDNYGGDYYGRDDSYGGDYYARQSAPAVCTSRERTYDPYTGQRITIERRYVC